MADETNPETPAHRRALGGGRSGDDHLIDPTVENAEAVNVDAQRRAAAAQAAAEPAPAGVDPLDHDGDGRKGGMRGFTPRSSRGASESE